MIKLNTRVITKHATATEWEASNLIILDGEVIIYDPDDSSPLPRFKVGNGTATPSQLPFIESESFSRDYNDLINTPVIPDISNLVDKEELNRYLTKDEYIAGESGGSIDLSYLLSKQEAQTLYAPKNILETVYPIGAIYLSVNNINPNALFGFGSWEQIKDTFLLACGDTWAADTSGGEATHTLSIEELPAHGHDFLRHQLWRTEEDPVDSTVDDGYGANNKTLSIYRDTTDPVGGGQAHNNMPPYLTVYMWKRIE